MEKFTINKLGSLGTSRLPVTSPILISHDLFSADMRYDAPRKAAAGKISIHGPIVRDVYTALQFINTSENNGVNISMPFSSGFRKTTIKTYPNDTMNGIYSVKNFGQALVFDLGLSFDHKKTRSSSSIIYSFSGRDLESEEGRIILGSNSKKNVWFEPEPLQDLTSAELYYRQLGMLGYIHVFQRSNGKTTKQFSVLTATGIIYRFSKSEGSDGYDHWEAIAALDYRN